MDVENNKNKEDEASRSQHSYNTPSYPQAGHFPLIGMMNMMPPLHCWPMPVGNEKNANTNISRTVEDPRNPGTVQKIQMTNWIAHEHGFQNDNLPLPNYPFHHMMPMMYGDGITNSMLFSGLAQSNLSNYSGSSPVTNPTVNCDSSLIKTFQNEAKSFLTYGSEIKKNKNDVDCSRSSTTTKTLNQKNTSKCPDKTENDPSRESVVHKSISSPNRDASITTKIPGVDEIPIRNSVKYPQNSEANPFDSQKNVDEFSKTSTLPHVNNMETTKAVTLSKMKKSKTNIVDPKESAKIQCISEKKESKQSSKNGKWLCDKCKVALFSTFEEASIHEQLCQGSSIKKGKSEKIVRSLFPKDPIVIRPILGGHNLKTHETGKHPTHEKYLNSEEIAQLSTFHIHLLKNIEIFEDISKVQDLSPNERLPVVEEGYLHRAASVGGMIGIRCIHCCKKPAMPFTLFPDSVNHFCSLLQQDCFQHFTNVCPYISTENSSSIKNSDCVGVRRYPNNFESFCRYFLNKIGIFDVTFETSRYLAERSYKLSFFRGLIYLGLAKSYKLDFPSIAANQNEEFTPKMNQMCYPFLNADLSKTSTTLSLLHKFTIHQLELKENKMGLIYIQCKHCKRERDHLPNWKKATKTVFSMGHSHLSSCKSIPQDLSSYLSAVKRMKKDNSSCTIGTYLTEVAKVYKIVEVIGKGVRFYDSQLYDHVMKRSNSSNKYKKATTQINSTPRKITTPRINSSSTQTEKKVPKSSYSGFPAFSSAPGRTKVSKAFVNPSISGLPLIDNRLQVKQDLSDYDRYTLKHFDITFLSNTNKLCLRCIYCRLQCVKLESIGDLCSSITSLTNHVFKCIQCPKYVTSQTTITRIKQGDSGIQPKTVYLDKLFQHYGMENDEKNGGVIFENQNKTVISTIKCLGLENISNEVVFGRAAIPILDEITTPFSHHMDPFFTLSFKYLELFEMNERKCLGVRCANCQIYALPIRSFHFMKDAICQVPDRHLRECLDMPQNIKKELCRLRDTDRTKTYMSLRKFSEVCIEHFNLVQLTHNNSNQGGGVAFGGIPIPIEQRKEYLLSGKTIPKSLSLPNIAYPFYDNRVSSATNISQYNCIALQQLELFQTDKPKKQLGLRCIHCHAVKDVNFQIIPSLASMHKIVYDMVYDHIFSCKNLPLKTAVDLKSLHKRQIVKCKRGIRTLCGEVARIFDLENVLDNNEVIGVSFKTVSDNIHTKISQTAIPMEYQMQSTIPVVCKSSTNNDKECAKYLIKENFDNVHIDIGDEYQVTDFPDLSKMSNEIDNKECTYSLVWDINKAKKNEQQIDLFMNTVPSYDRESSLSILHEADYCVVKAREQYTKLKANSYRWNNEEVSIFHSLITTEKNFYYISNALQKSVSECLKYYYSQYKPNLKHRSKNLIRTSIKTPAISASVKSLTTMPPFTNMKKRAFSFTMEGQKNKRQRVLDIIELMADPFKHLHQSEMDLAWLGEESRRLTGKKAFDLDFIERYAEKLSPSLYKIILEKKGQNSYTLNPIPRLMRYHDLVIREIFMRYRNNVSCQLRRGICPEGWEKVFKHWEDKQSSKL